jgi:hypothetical protein
MSPAEAVFREGREAAARGDKKTACAKFEESVRLARAPGPLLNVADCEESSGRLVSAAKRWQEGIALLDPGDDRLPFAKERAAALDKRLPRLTVRVSPGSSGARVEIDGVLVPPSEAGKPQPVDPGAHKVVVTSGASAGDAAVTVAEGERREVTVTLASAAGGGDGGPSAAEPGSGLRTAGFIAAGVGALGLAVFGVTAGLLSSRSATVEAQCDAQKQCSQEGFDAAESGKALVPVNTAAMIIGIAGVTAGVTLLVVGSRSSSSSAPTAALRAAGSPGGFSASVVGTF